MDISNSSMYDGGTALAEAAMLASGHTKRKNRRFGNRPSRIARGSKTYAKGQYIDVVEVPSKNGTADLEALDEAVCEDTAAVIVQYPNFSGELSR